MGLTSEEKRERSIEMTDVKTFEPIDAKPYVFISYKSDDWKVVLDVVVRQMVNRYGLRVYYDKNFDKDNAQWVENMKGAMFTSNCKALLAFVSREYMQSYACCMELMTVSSDDAETMNKGERVPIIPLIIDRSKNVSNATCNNANKAYIEEWDSFQKAIKAAKGGSRAKDKSVKKTLTMLQKAGENTTLEQISVVMEKVLTFETHQRDITADEFDEYLWKLKLAIEKISNAVFDESLIGSCNEKKELVNNLENLIDRQDVILEKNDDEKAHFENAHIEVSEKVEVSSAVETNLNVVLAELKGNLWHYSNRKGANATIIWENEYTKKCVIKKGSKVGEEAASFATSVPAASSLKQELIEKGIIVDGIFQMDYPSDKISTMINLIGGGSINMRGEIQKGSFAQVSADNSMNPIDEANKQDSQEIVTSPLIEDGQEVHFQDAKAILSGKGCIVKIGSLLAMEIADSCSESVKRIRNEALQNGELEEQNGKYVLKVDKEFGSLSAAAGFVCGYSVNGKTAWK